MDSPTIALQGINGLMFVRPDEIMYANADGSYTDIQLTNNRTSKVIRQLEELEDLVPQGKFVRIHRSSIVNLDHVIQLDNETVVMTDGVGLELARDRKMEFIEKFTRM